jgi:tetratricopeptide (TPR) repeat protein
MPENTPISEAEIHHKLATDYMSLGVFEIAVDELLRATELEPGNEYYWDKLGIAYGEMEDYESSQKAFERALMVNSKFAPAYCNLGMNKYRSGRTDESINFYNKAIALQPEIAVFYFNRALAYSDNENEEQALQDYCHALELDKRMIEAYACRAEIYIQKKMWKKSIADLRKILKLEESKITELGSESRNQIVAKGTKRPEDR